MNAPSSKRLGVAFTPWTVCREGVMASGVRSETVALRRVVGGADDASGMSSASWKPYQADLVLASCTDQRTSAPESGTDSSRMMRPSALTP